MAAAKDSKVPWWLLLLEGIVLIFLSMMWLVSPGMTTVVAVRILGVYWLVAGIFTIIAVFLDRAMWGLKLVGGLVGTLAGLLVIDHPLLATAVTGATLVFVVGILGVIIGLVGLCRAFKVDGAAVGLLAVISLIFGVLLLLNIGAVTQALPWILGGLSLLGGIAAIAMAFSGREKS